MRERDGARVAECRRTTHGGKEGGREDGRTERASERGDPRAFDYFAQSSSVRQPVIFRTNDRQLAWIFATLSAPAENRSLIFSPFPRRFFSSTYRVIVSIMKIDPAKVDSASHRRFDPVARIFCKTFAWQRGSLRLSLRPPFLFSGTVWISRNSASRELMATTAMKTGGRPVKRRRKKRKEHTGKRCDSSCH